MLARTINRDLSAEFASDGHVRIPAAIAANSRALDVASSLTRATLTEGTQAVALTTNVYSAITLSEKT